MQGSKGSAALDGRHKPGLVLLAGPLIHFPIVSHTWQFIVAADGGARHALAQGVWPTHVVGDFDSLSVAERAKLATAGVSTTALPRAKDLTDGEAAVKWAVAHYVRTPEHLAGADANRHERVPFPIDIVIAGGLAGRFDHALASLTLLELVADAGLAGVVTDGDQQVFLLRHTLHIVGEPGDVLSIVPLSDTVTGLSLRGVRWPLHRTTIHAKSTLTMSNEFAHAHVTLSAEAGRAAVVRVPHPR